MSAVPISDLESLGIEEIDVDVCEDTAMNRRILRVNSFFWEILWNEDQTPTGLIRVFSPAAMTDRRDSVWERRRPIMVDPDDRYSEYVGPEGYPSDFTDMPWYVKQRLTWWIQIQLGEREAGSHASRPFPARCKIVRTDGTRCWNWALKPHEIPRCKSHAGWTRDDSQMKAIVARQRLIDAMPDAADSLIDLALNAEGESVRAKATETILAIGGVRAGHELEVTVKDESSVDPAAAVRERLDRLAVASIEAARRESEAQATLSAAVESQGTDIVDAVLVEDTDGEEAESSEPAPES